MSALINDPVLGSVVTEILNELSRSKGLHPRYTDDTVRRAAIVVEEALESIHEMVHRTEELMKAALQATRTGQTNQTRNMDDLRKELVQTAAMCIKHLEAMSYEEGDDLELEAERG